MRRGNGLSSARDKLCPEVIYSAESGRRAPSGQDTRTNPISTPEIPQAFGIQGERGEAQLSAQQAQAQAQAWFPRADEHQAGAEDPGAASGAQAQDADGVGGGGPRTGLVMARLNTLKDRRDFVRLKSGRRWITPAFVLQAAPRSKSEDTSAPGPRFGFTVSRHAVAREGPRGRKRGGAVRRNRARRRLKEAVRIVAPLDARPEFDYVVIGRAAALDRDFGTMLDDLRKAFARVHAPDQPAKENRASRPT